MMIDSIEAAEAVIREYEAKPEKLPCNDWSEHDVDATPTPPQQNEVSPDVKAAENNRQDHRVPARMDNVPLSGGARLRYKRIPFESNGPGDFEEIDSANLSKLEDG
jgi:hypothetical protein